MGDKMSDKMSDKMAARMAARMAPSAPSHRPVRQLPPEVARKIAAGEVIDRPQAIVRELMDNAVDSGADRISVEISGGGIDSIRISDNGSGMSREDLASCARPHATSKIADAEDLMKLTTLGFRGEALASIAAVARLSISSGTFRMRASITEDHLIEEIPPVQNGKGTIVSSEGLFENFPARRVFLKRPASETMMCRETFVEKALARTDISFRLTIDGKVRYDLPAGVSLSERFVQALELKEDPKLFYELKGTSPRENDIIPWSFRLIIGEPSIYRTDRKQLFIFVNGRKVQEYSLLQAIEYGCQGFFPNGTHPVSALFVQMDPSLVDFNIHPAKKEVRFKDSSDLHHAVSSTVRDFFRNYGIHASREEVDLQKTFADFDDTRENSKTAAKSSTIPSVPETIPSRTVSPLAEAALDEDFFEVKPKRIAEPSPSQSGDWRSRFFNYEKAVQRPFVHEKKADESLSEKAVPPADEKTTSSFMPFLNDSIEAIAATGTNSPDVLEKDADGFRYLGTVLGTFLVAESGDTLYFIDQHAAHERILFDRLLASTSDKQPLLVPYTIKTESTEDDDYLKTIQDSLKKIGFTLVQNDGYWECTTTPARWTGTEGEFKEALFEKRTDPSQIMYSIAAMTACKAAVKDGYILDRKTAASLAKSALALPDPHCPHGRPVWTTLTREQLFDRVRRTR